MKDKIKSNLKLNGIPLRYILFSDNTVQLHSNTALLNLVREGQTLISWTEYTPNDLILLLQLMSVLKENFNTDAYSFELMCPYLPFGRYDRAMFEADVFSLKVFADIINSLNFDKIIVADPHNASVTMNLFNNIEIVTKNDLIGSSSYVNVLASNDILDFNNYDALVAPDKGSFKELSEISALHDKELIIVNKTRDPETGKLSGAEITNLEDLESFNRVLILDDICDGGGTFIMVADLLKESLNINTIDLCITHGIFSKGLDALSGIDNIYCYNQVGNYI